MVRGDGHRVFINNHLGTRSVSQLLIKNAQPSDSGIYTCSPAHSREHFVSVHVVTGERTNDFFNIHFYFQLVVTITNIIKYIDINNGIHLNIKYIPQNVKFSEISLIKKQNIHI